MTTQVIQSPVWLARQFTDALGNRLAGGRVYTYVQNNNPTVQQTTYANTTADNTGTLYGDSPNTNPIILNESGMMDTGFFVISGNEYTYVLTDYLGNFLEQYPPRINYLAAYSVTCGNGDSTYTPPGRYNGYATQPCFNAYAGVTGANIGFGSFTTLSNAAHWATPTGIFMDEDGGLVILWPTADIGTISWSSVVITNDSTTVTIPVSISTTIFPTGYFGWLVPPAVSWTIGDTYNVSFL